MISREEAGMLLSVAARLSDGALELLSTPDGMRGIQWASLIERTNRAQAIVDASRRRVTQVQPQTNTDGPTTPGYSPARQAHVDRRAERLGLDALDADRRESGTSWTVATRDGHETIVNETKP